MQTKLNIIFMGTPEFSVQTLESLINSHHKISAVYTQPPRPSGRGHAVQQSPVHQMALKQNIPVYTPINFKNEDDIKAFQSHAADIAVVVAYGLILPKEILKTPRYGCLNIHASLLPRWRGAAPIQRALLAGDKTSGISIMQMELGLDTGPVMMKRSVPLLNTTTTPLLHDELACLGADMIVPCLDQIAQNTAFFEEQNEAQATYAHKLTKQEGLIDWKKSAADIDRMIRALNPWPGTWCLLPENKKLKIKQAILHPKKSTRPGTIIDKNMTVACQEGAIELTRVQPENKKEMDGAAFLNGSSLKPQDRL